MNDRKWVRVERVESVAVVRFDRPPANALDLDAIAELGETLRDLASSDDVRSAVLTGTGKFFSAGLDLKALPNYTAEQRRDLVESVNEMIAVVYGVPMPLIAAINGHATAGGLVLALLCEHRLVARGSIKMGLSEIRVGIPFPAASFEVIQAEISRSTLRRLVLAGTYVDPHGALAAGIVDEVIVAEALLSRAVALAKELGSMPLDGYRRIKRQIRGAVIDRLEHIRASSDPMLDGWTR